MSAPAYQLIGNRYPGSGALGTSPLGLAPLGGSAYPIYTVPALYLGSDDLAKRLRTDDVGPRHERYGVVVGQRRWAKIGRWHVVHRGLTEAQGLELSVFADAGTFYLLPTGNPMQSARTVRWIGRQFDLRQVRGGRYTLEYDLEERP